MDDRKTFLISMYDQLCHEMDRHIKVIWQIVGVLLSTFAIFALVEKNIISIDIAASILIAVCGLAIAIIIESNFWYNRNLVIVANIERQFLDVSDAAEIHYYFTKHRKNNAYLDMMLIQMLFVGLILLIITAYHFSESVLPTLSIDNKFDLKKSLPYLILIITLIALYLFHRKRIRDFNEFKTNSPGKILKDVPEFRSNSDHVT